MSPHRLQCVVFTFSTSLWCPTPRGLAYSDSENEIFAPKPGDKHFQWGKRLLSRHGKVESATLLEK